MEKGTKALRKMQSFLHFLAFGFFDLLFGVLRGEQPLRRASRAFASSGHLFRFLFGCPKRKALAGAARDKRMPPQGGGIRQIPHKKFQKTIDIKPAFNATLVVETNPGKGPVTYG